jgi:hypothetical protein
MLIRQRSTFADDFLLRMVFPYLHDIGATRLTRLACFWNPEVGSVPAPATPLRPTARIHDAWKRLAHVLLSPAAKASAN